MEQKENSPAACPARAGFLGGVNCHKPAFIPQSAGGLMAIRGG